MAVCRELTKRFEEVLRGSAAELAGRLSEPLKGEITVVIGGGFGHAAFDQLVEPARQVVRRDALAGAGDVPIVPAKLGLTAGMIGAALAAHDALQ